jgi:rubredoxin
MLTIVRYSTPISTHSWVCPSCEFEFARTVSAQPIFIGPGTRRCNACGLVFTDGSVEWNQLSRKQKLRHLVPIEILLAVSICSTSGAAIAVALGASVVQMLCWVSGIFCAIVGPFYAKWIWEIGKSKRRFRTSGPAVFQAHSGPVIVTPCTPDTIDIRCPSDGTVYHAHASQIGKSIRCLKCGAVLKIER